MTLPISTPYQSIDISLRSRPKRDCDKGKSGHLWACLTLPYFYLWHHCASYLLFWPSPSKTGANLGFKQEARPYRVLAVQQWTRRVIVQAALQDPSQTSLPETYSELHKKYLVGKWNFPSLKFFPTRICPSLLLDQVGRIWVLLFLESKGKLELLCWNTGHDMNRSSTSTLD